MVRIALVAALLASTSAYAQYAPTVGSTLRQLGGRPVWVPICARGRGLPGSGGAYDSTDNSVFDQTICNTPSWGSVSALKIVYPGFDLSQYGETDRTSTSPITGYASIFLPSTSITVYNSAAIASGATSFTTTLGQGLSGNSARVGALLSATGIPSGTYVTSIVPAYASTGLQTSLTVNISAATTASIAASTAITATGSIYPATLGGQRQWTIFPTHQVFTSDPVSVSLPLNSQFDVRGSWTFPSTSIVIADTPSPASGSSRISGEGSQRGTNLADHTLDPTTPSNSGAGYWPPVTVLGLVTPNAGVTPPGAVLILGDSIAAGTGDSATATSTAVMGYIQRALGTAVPWVSLARGSTSATQMQASGTPGIVSLAIDTGITDVFLQHAHNDLISGVSFATTRTELIAIAQPFLRAGMRVWIFTVPPTTTSTDGWTTTANQTISNTTYDTQRQNFNAYCRGTNGTYTPQGDGFAGCIDDDLYIEDQANPGKFRVDLGAASTDGTHPSAVLHAAAVVAVPMGALTR